MVPALAQTEPNTNTNTAVKSWPNDFIGTEGLGLVRSQLDAEAAVYEVSPNRVNPISLTVCGPIRTGGFRLADAVRHRPGAQPRTRPYIFRNLGGYETHPAHRGKRRADTQLAVAGTGGASIHLSCSRIRSCRRSTASASGILNFTAVLPT
jgi:hypothetical protein